jgi:hypothetical protein
MEGVEPMKGREEDSFRPVADAQRTTSDVSQGKPRGY